MRTVVSLLLVLLVSITASDLARGQYSQKQLGQWLKRFPQADADGDGKLTVEEANAFRKKLLGGNRKPGAKRNFNVDKGWFQDRFPDHAVCYKSPKEIAGIYTQKARGSKAIVSYEKPPDGSLRIVGTGHSFMGPGYKTFPIITKAAGLKQPPLVTHTGGGMTGSTRYKWEQENGIFQFDGKPTPKLLASISNARWDAMMWGPYFNDQPEYYECWIEFCLKYNPDMKFYLSDAWPQLDQLREMPSSEEALTDAAFEKMGSEKNKIYGGLIGQLNKQFPDKVYIMPTSDAMVLAVKHYHLGQLPGVDGIHKLTSKKERSLWRDRLGHLGPGLGQLEGYVFYATLYGESPEKIDGEISFGNKSNYPSAELDQMFRKIAWQAVINNPLSGVKDVDGDGVGD